MATKTDIDAFDKYTLVHALTGFLVGVDKRVPFDEAIIAAIGYELVENTVISKYTSAVSQESITNAVVDVVVFAVAYVIGKQV